MAPFKGQKAPLAPDRLDMLRLISPTYTQPKSHQALLMQEPLSHTLLEATEKGGVHSPRLIWR